MRTEAQAAGLGAASGSRLSDYLGLCKLRVVSLIVFTAIVGMFLAVPIMVMTGIVCAQFKGLRWVVVILSADGSLVSDSRPAHAR